MRGYFGIGVESISKPMNLGNLMRSAHAFEASFFFTVAPAFNAREVAKSDTSGASAQMPLYTFDTPATMVLPNKCRLVGVEFDEDAEFLPEFRHPVVAAYVLGREKGSLSPEMVARCDALVKIPTKFCINVGVAGALVMYDRLISHGGFGRRPVNPRAAAERLATGTRHGDSAADGDGAAHGGEAHGSAVGRAVAAAPSKGNAA